MNRNQQLKPGYNQSARSSVKGKQLFNTMSLLKKEASPGDSYQIVLPKLSENKVIVAHTICLSFRFKNSNTKLWFLNNLGRQLVEGLKITMAGETLYDNNGESIMEIYKDLWLREKKRLWSNMVLLKNTRNILSGDDSKADTVDDVLLGAKQEVLKLKLGKILEGHGPYAPYNMGDFVYTIKLPQAKSIMVAQSGENVEGYRITDINLEFQSIEGEEIAKDTRGKYDIGRQLWFDRVQLLKTEV